MAKSAPRDTLDDLVWEMLLINPELPLAKNKDIYTEKLNTYIKNQVEEARLDELYKLVDDWRDASSQHTTARYGFGIKHLEARINQLRKAK